MVSYGISMVAAAIEALSERFRIFFISELLMIFTFFPASIMAVVRIPILLTMPRNPFTSTISPTLYWFSTIINRPVTRSAIRLSAPKPMTRAMTPRLATIALTSTPQMVSAQQKTTMTAA